MPFLYRLLPVSAVPPFFYGETHFLCTELAIYISGHRAHFRKFHEIWWSNFGETHPKGSFWSSP